MLFNEINLAMHIQSNKARMKKLRKALQGVAVNTSCTTPKEWSANSIRSWFGGKDNLSKIIRDILIVCVDDSYANFDERKYCKKYLRNKDGFEYLCSVAGNKVNVSYEEFLNFDAAQEARQSAKEYSRQYDSVLVRQLMEREYCKELKSKKFNMKRIGSREYHPIQSMKKQARAALLESYGLMYDYDIECAAPSLLYEHAARAGLKKKLKHIKTLVSDPVLYRYRVWSELNVQINSLNTQSRLSIPQFTMSEVKRIITALFCGARVCYKGEAFNRYAISKMLDNNRYKLMLIANNNHIGELKKEISLMWGAIKSTETHKINAKTGRAFQLTSRQKWAIYFRLECKVMTAVKVCLDLHKIKYLTIHDGMRTDKLVDVQWLSEEVFCSTGYRVQFATNDVDDGDDEMILDQDCDDESLIELTELDALFQLEGQEEEEEELELAY